jgi:hypothetical protein
LEQRVSLREVEDVVDVLALREAPEMDRNVVFSSSEWILLLLLLLQSLEAG